MYDLKTTVAEDMYLITISMINPGDPAKPVPLSALAEALDVQPVSANQMIKRMAEKGWVDYFPYQGVVLTDRGSEHARRVMWSRCLWEVFLVRDLGMSLEQAEVIACDLEHHISKDVAERLDGFLDYPEFCYHGERIPRESSQKGRSIKTFPLKDLEIGTEAVIVEIDTDSVTLKFLFNEGIRPGALLGLIAIGSSGDYLVEIAGSRVHISENIASEVILRDKA